MLQRYLSLLRFANLGSTLDSHYSLIKAPNSILKEIVNFKSIAYHHSSAQDSVIIKIVQDDKITVLKICQDSQVKDEYWVYYPLKYKTSKDNELGRLKTNELRLFK